MYSYYCDVSVLGNVGGKVGIRWNPSLQTINMPALQIIEGRLGIHSNLAGCRLDSPDICSDNTCDYPYDNECDDGGPGSDYNVFKLLTHSAQKLKFVFKNILSFFVSSGVRLGHGLL